jgi:hypothetical protein
MTYFWYRHGSDGIPPTWGDKTEDFPRLDELPYLPADWIAALLSVADTNTLDLGASVIGVPDLMATFPAGEPCDKVLRAREIAEGHTGVHDKNRDDLFKAFRLGIEGHPGADQLIAFLMQQRYDYVIREHPERRVEADVSKLVRDTASHAQRMISSGSHATDCVSTGRAPLITMERARVLTGLDGSEETAASEETEDTDAPEEPAAPGFVSAPTSDSWDLSGFDDEPADTSEVDSEFNLPAEVWEFSDEMRAIRQAAFSRKVSPDVVLHGCLALIASLVNYTSNVETGSGPSPLNYYAAAVGGSGAGKTKGFEAADDLMSSWVGGQRVQLGTDGYARAELSTGEGMVEAFMGEKSEFEHKLDEHGDPLYDDDGEPIGRPKKYRAQVRHNAMYVSDEGRQMLAHASRPGSTILNTLCSLWSGASAGSSNAKAENTRTLERRSYAIGLFVGFQPATMQSLFEDEAGGAPQRFAYANAHYKGLPRFRVPFPDQLSPQVPPYTGVNIVLSDEQQDEVINWGIDVTDKIIELGKFDGHYMLLRCRIAALLSILHSKVDVVSDEIWKLSKTIVDTSCAFRNDLAELAQREAAEAARKRSEMQVQANVKSAMLVSQNSKLDAAADKIVELVESTEDEADCTPTKITKRLTASLRSVKAPALAKVLEEGRLETVEITNPRNGPKMITILRVKD